MSTFRAYPSYPCKAPGSQESLASFGSGTATSSGHSVMATSSDVSQATTADTDMTSPTSPHNHTQQGKFVFPSHHVEQGHDLEDEHRQKLNNARLRTPESQVDASRRASDNIATTPMSISTPVNGHKRMASGQIKSAQLSSPNAQSRAGAARAGSVGSNGSRASEVAANLKDRLSYAMAKVQHGWEHHNIDQVEQLAAAAISPRTIISPRGLSSRAGHMQSPRSAGFPSRALIDHMPNHRPHSDYTQPLRSATLLPPSRLDRNSSDSSLSPPTKRRTQADSVISPHTHLPPHRLVSPTSPPLQSHNPTTPHHRPSTIRTQTQTAQAEQEAMSALLLMGSPSNGTAQRQRGSQTSSAAQSPGERKFGAVAPRQALVYRRSESEGSVGGQGQGEEVRRLRGGLLDSIEDED